MIATIQYKTQGYREKVRCERIDMTDSGLSFKLISSSVVYTPEFPDGQKCATTMLELETGSFQSVSISEK